MMFPPWLVALSSKKYPRSRSQALPKNIIKALQDKRYGACFLEILWLSLPFYHRFKGGLVGLLTRVDNWVSCRCYCSTNTSTLQGAMGLAASKSWTTAAALMGDRVD